MDATDADDADRAVKEGRFGLDSVGERREALSPLMGGCMFEMSRDGFDGVVDAIAAEGNCTE